MTSKLSRKPCQVDVKIDPNLDHRVSVVSAFIVVRVDGRIVNVGLDGSAGIHVRGVSRELGVVRDVEVGDNLVVGVDSVGDHVCVVGRELGVVHDVEVGDNLVVGVDSVGDHVCVVGRELGVVHDVEVGDDLVVGVDSVGDHLVVRDHSVGGHVVAAILGFPV